MTTRKAEHPDSDADPTPTASPTRAPAATAVSQRRLVVGVCATIVAVAFESIAVATAMPVAARDLDGFDHYAWSFSVFVIGMLFATVVGATLLILTALAHQSVRRPRHDADASGAA